MKKLVLLFLLSITTVTVFASNQALRCSGIDQESRAREDLFFYDGETIVMIGGGTENMYVPLVSTSGKNKTFENNKYFITISAKSIVTIDMKGIYRHVYGNVRCESTGE